MRAVILAAGRGKRLAPMGWDRPKCLLEFGPRSLLDNIIASLLENGIDRVALVVGYRQELVLEAMRRHPVQCDVVVNPEYAETNTINSLHRARAFLNEDFLYFNADVLFDRRIVARLLAHDGCAFAIDEGACGQEEVKVIVDDDRRIVRIGKALAPQECLGEFIGIGKFSRAACPDLLEALRDYNEERNQRNLFFESAVDDIVGQHVFLAVSIGRLAAIEIDSPEDYRAAGELWDSGQMGA